VSSLRTRIYGQLIRTKFLPFDFRSDQSAIEANFFAASNYALRPIVCQENPDKAWRFQRHPTKHCLIGGGYRAGNATGTRKRHMSRVFAFLKDESGATAIEYGLIAAGISVVIIATVNAIGSNLNAKFNFISTQLK
jgi:pilus assembly protein Flp/PilA